MWITPCLLVLEETICLKWTDACMASVRATLSADQLASGEAMDDLKSRRRNI
jgi:hypothetical protein